MFLTERIVSLLIYAAVLFIAYQLIGKVTRNQCKSVLHFYLIVLAVFAFNYKPYVTADLYRLREYIEYWIYKDWNGVIKYAVRSSSPTWVLYSYVLSKLGNINWLQTVTCLWCFGNVFYIIGHEIERNKTKRTFRSELLFYIMAVGAFYLQTISGIRSMLGISIVGFCFYREVVENKNIAYHLPLWLFAALLHTSTMVLVISRFLFLVIQGKGIARKVILGIFVLLLALFSRKYLGNYIDESLMKGKAYLTSSKEYSYVWGTVIGLIETSETIFVLYHYHESKLYSGHEIECKYRLIYLFTLMWTIISIAAFPFSYAVFTRYTIFCTVMSIPLVARLFESDKANKIKKILFYISFLIFALSGVRGDLCGYKFFVIS